MGTVKSLALALLACASFAFTDCDGVAWITIDDIFDGVVAWRASDYRDEPDRVNERLIDHGITVEGSAKKAKVTFGSQLQAFPPPR